MNTFKPNGLTQDSIKKITGEVAISMVEQPAFTAFTFLSAQRAKKASVKLVSADFTVSEDKLAPNTIRIINEYND